MILIPEKAECEIGYCDAAEDKDEREDLGSKMLGDVARTWRGGDTYHSLVGDWLYKRIEDLCKSMRRHPRPSYTVRILVHTLLPILTYSLHRRYAVFFVTSVLPVILRAYSQLGQGFGDGMIGGFIDVVSNSRPEGVNDVDEEEDEEDIEEELCVEGENVG